MGGGFVGVKLNSESIPQLGLRKNTAKTVLIKLLVNTKK